MFGNQPLFNLFHVLKNGIRTCDLCGSCAVVYQLLVILLLATGIWGFPVVTVHVKFITLMIFYLPYMRKADIFSHTWPDESSYAKCVRHWETLHEFLQCYYWRYDHSAKLFFWYVAKMYVLKVCVRMCSYFSSIVVSIVILLDFPDDLIPNCIANFKTNFRQREHKQQEKLEEFWSSVRFARTIRANYQSQVSEVFHFFITNNDCIIPLISWQR